MDPCALTCPQASDGKSVKFLTKPLDVLRTKTSTVHNAPAHPVQAIQERVKTASANTGDRVPRAP